MKKGDWVTWKSQSGGIWRRKTGQIVAIVPKGKKPWFYNPQSMIMDEKTMSAIRPLESYLVKIPGDNRVYHPYVSYLRKCKGRSFLSWLVKTLRKRIM